MTNNIITTYWLRVTKHNPCPVCGKPDWCLISSDNKAAICARTESDTIAGQAGWLHRFDNNIPLTVTLPRSTIKQSRKASGEVLTNTYNAFLSELSLSESHKDNLAHRGLSESQISALGYKTLPLESRKDIIRRLTAMNVTFTGVPGFYRNELGHWHIAGAPGILIPVRNIVGNIQGFQIRCDDTATGKYKWFSSANRLDGSSPGSPVHVARSAQADCSELWITEGMLKGDIISLKLNRIVLAVSGVGNWAGIIPIIQELKPKRVIVAYDMDKSSNIAVKLHCKDLITYLVNHEIRTFEADWDTHFKGLDDLLKGG